MAHEIETMAYAGAVPWHKLGTNINPNSSIEEWQLAAGLNWEVNKHSVKYNAYNNNFEEVDTYTFQDKFVLARNTDNKPYSIVSSRYKPVQPKEILEFFRDLVSDFGMSIETAGSLRDGQRIWALANTNDSHKVMNVDSVKGYLLLATSYDLTFSTLAQFTSIRVVCNNTLQQSFKDSESRVTIPHFREFNMNQVKEEMGIGRSQWESFTKTLDTLANIKLDVIKAKEVLNNVYKITNPEEVNPADKHISKIINLFTGKGIGSDIAGRTAWGLVNATTEYIDKHTRAHTPGNRLDSAWFGNGFNIKQRVVDESLLLAA